MDNLMNFQSEQFDYNFFRSSDEEQRKVHTPFIQPCQYDLENVQNCKAISEKIDFTPIDHISQKKSKGRKTKIIQEPNANKRSGHWCQEQNKRYHWFLQVHHQHFFKKHLRRTDRIFKSMASFVQTREAEQCRSHHQKMEKKYKYFSKILMNLRQQNYGCLDSEPIITEMLNKQISIKLEDIVSRTYLQNYQQSSQGQSDSQQSKQNKTPKQCFKSILNTFQTLPFSIEQREQIQQDGFNDNDYHYSFGAQQQFKNYGINQHISQQPIYHEIGHENNDNNNSNNVLDDIFNDTYQKRIQFHGFF